jgi:hypothetical protein
MVSIELSKKLLRLSMIGILMIALLGCKSPVKASSSTQPQVQRINCTLLTDIVNIKIPIKIRDKSCQKISIFTHTPVSMDNY